MKSSVTIKTHGNEIRAELRGKLKEAVMASAKRVKADAGRRINSQTGTLKRSGRIVPWEKKHAVGAYVAFGSKKDNDENGEAYYAGHVELGTSSEVYTRGKRRKGSLRKPVGAHPYLRPAARKEKRRFFQNCRDALK